MCSARRGAFDRAVVSTIAAVVAVVGCQNGPDVVEVTGTITRNGKPLKEFAVIFQPESGRPSVGQTDENGYYELSYTLKRKGALRGKHKVFVQYSPIDLQASMAVDAGRMPPDIKDILAKYGDEDITPIEVEIDGSQVVDLKLD